MTIGDSDLVEVLILGRLVVRRADADVVGLTPALANTLVLLAARGGPVQMRDLKDGLGVGKDSVHQNIHKLGRLGITIRHTGRGDTGEYHLDMGTCLVDAAEFVRGVEDEQDIDTLLRLWRGPVPEFPKEGLRSRYWADVKAARSELIQRISGLSDADRMALAELSRFADLFPGDQEVDRIRPSKPVILPSLLVVEDDPDMMRQMSRRLEARYSIMPLRDIDEWFDFRDNNAAKLDLIQGALIDLSLTSRLNDKEGLEIVTYLRDKTNIAVALVTANSLEDRDFKQRERMALYRLVDIVNKRSDNWYNALEDTARLLVGNGLQERRKRMETWLNAAHQKVMMETSDSDPDSVEGHYRRTRHEEWASLLGRVQVENVDDIEAAVRRFCANCGASGALPRPFSGSPALPAPWRRLRRRGQG